jgi:hypothetical protein
VVRVRLAKKATSLSVLVVLGVRRDGQKVLLALRNMGGESEAAAHIRAVRRSPRSPRRDHRGRGRWPVLGDRAIPQTDAAGAAGGEHIVMGDKQ